MKLNSSGYLAGAIVICAMEEKETKIIYHVDDEETPYLVKLPISPDKVTLADFKNVFNRPNYKFFFKSMDDDFGYANKLLRTLLICANYCSEIMSTSRFDPLYVSFICLYSYISALVFHSL